MVHLTWTMVLFLLTAGFLASFVDSMVGGGGLISLPALLLTGMPASMALGTNKLAGTVSSLTSTVSYFRSGKIQFSLIRYLFPLSLVGAAIGAFTVRHIPSSFLNPLVIFLLIAVTVYTIFKRDLGARQSYAGISRKVGWVGAFAALGLGFYDGFFGPGTGSFLIFAFIYLGFDFVHSSGNAKALNFGSNIAALITFIALHSVAYEYGLIMGISMILGAIAGSQFAIRRGAAYMRPIFVVVTLLVVGKQCWQLFVH